MQRRQSQPNPIMTTAFSTDYPHHQHPLKSPTHSISSSSSTPLSLLALPSTDENRRPSTETSSPSSPAELERELHHMSTRLQQAESRIDRLKSANRMSIVADSPDQVCKRASENAIKDQVQDLYMTKTRLEQTCNDLRQERDKLMAEIAALIDHPPNNKIEADVWEKMILGPFETQLSSVRHDIQEAQAEYDRLDQARNEVMSDMVLLNTKNAELNALNNDLSRRMTQREREAVAFMAGTNFLDTAGKKHSDEIASAEEETTSRLRKLKNKRMMFFGKSPSTSTLSSTSSSHQRKSSNSCLSINGDDPQPQPQPQQHRLVQSKKFIRPMKCEGCGEKIWRASEYKCQACGAVCHTKCIPNIPPCTDNQNDNSVPPPLPPKEERTMSMVFGNDLATQIQLEHGSIPVIVQKCVEAVEARGMDSEGIYRRSGGAGQTREIQQLFDQGKVPDLTDDVSKWNDISAITSVLKLYFRNLPDPLFTFALHDSFIQAILNKDPGQRLDIFHRLLHNALPSENYNTLKHLIRHLVRVQEQHHVNLMNTRNLAVVFGPTLLRNPDENKDLLEMNRKIEIIDYMIRNEHELFNDDGHQHPMASEASFNTYTTTTDETIASPDTL